MDKYIIYIKPTETLQDRFEPSQPLYLYITVLKGVVSGMTNVFTTDHNRKVISRCKVDIIYILMIGYLFKFVVSKVVDVL